MKNKDLTDFVILGLFIMGVVLVIVALVIGVSNEMRKNDMYDYHYVYCPYCGANMKGGGEHG